MDTFNLKIAVGLRKLTPASGKQKKRLMINKVIASFSDALSETGSFHQYPMSLPVIPVSAVPYLLARKNI
ncbi:MAG TPA: hypothetical protein ENJ84_03680 [Gammaproteobacteria bacterium]|nr:hypothetical protein [Gammaproteobacteria bacterium]